MKRYLLLAFVLMTACAMPALTQTQPVVIVQPVPVVAVPPVPAPIALSAPVPLPAPPLTILDASQVTVTLADSTLTIALAPNVSGVWLRLILLSGAESGITDSGACQCIGLGGEGPHQVNSSFLAGMTVYTSATLDGPWTIAAKTK